MLQALSEQSTYSPSHKAPKVILCVPAVMLLFASAAHAAGSQADYGFTPFLQAGYLYDSNLFRLSGQSEAQSLLGSSHLSDMVYQAGGGLKYRVPVSQQTFTLAANGLYNKYDRYDYLDYTSGGASAAWDWKYGKSWNGLLSATYARDLQGFEETQIARKDIRNQSSFFAGANFAMTPRWLLHVAAARDEQQHSLSARKNLDRTIDRGVAEIRFTSPRGSYLGYKTVVRSGDYPNRDLVAATQVDNSYKEYENSLTVNWVESAQSKLDGNLGYTTRNYDTFSTRDFSGATWRLDYEWRPPSKLGLNASLWRDLDAYSDQISSYVVESAGSLEALWFATTKLTFKADASKKYRDYSGDPNLNATPAPSRHDRVVGYGVSAEYALRERLKFDLGYLYENRESNVKDKEYDYYNLMATITAIF